MQNKSKIYKLKGTVQHYNWGGYQFLPALLNMHNTGKKPFAEYWLGAHTHSPSGILLPDHAKESLDKFINHDPSAVLGKPVYKVFARLPYLLKVLDVKDMLSIQLHPTKEAAEKGFANENRKGIPLTAADRNYKDSNHKLELMVALSEFWLLHGFKPADLLKRKLQQVKELNFLSPFFENDNYASLYRHVMEMDQQQVNEKLLPLINHILADYENGALSKEDEHFWAARAFRIFCTADHIDRGIFSIYFLNVVHLQAGEAIFQNAGILHAYLEGQNMEIMSSSDNVLRGGLTNKHIDVNELMKHVVFGPVVPENISGISIDDTEEEVFPSPAVDFELRQMQLEANQDSIVKTHTADIFFVYEGKANVQCEKESLQLHKGEALLAVAGSELNWKALDKTTVFHATVPYPQA